MYSIRKKLVRSISMVLLVILLALFLVIDLTIDGLAKKQFDDVLQQKANLLVTLVKEYEDHVEFDFAGEFMPQFEKELKGAFFQLWRNNETFEKSESLNVFSGIDLYHTEIPIGSHIFIDQELPDGRYGRILLIHFLPQIQSGRGEISDQKSMYLSIAVPFSDLEYLLELFDALLLITLVLTILFSRYLVKRVVNQGLAPLLDLNEKIKRLDMTQGNALIDKPKICVTEIEPIRMELNKFLTENKLLIENEKRLTSDITHEIKTPITEIISLTEMSIKYPDEQRINKTYKEDILNSANRLKDIVQKVSLLHRSDDQGQTFQEKKHPALATIQNVLASFAFKYPKQINSCIISNPDSIEDVLIDEFCFNQILSNLLDNAFFYGDVRQKVQINILKSGLEIAKIEISNHVVQSLTPEQLNNIFEPFYQVDQARTDSLHHGLGLSIVKKLSDLADYNIEMGYQDGKITFTFHVAFV